MLKVNTADWPEPDRLERWREEFGKRVVGADVTSPPASAGFQVSLALLPGESLALTRMGLRGVCKVRDRGRFGDGADDLTLMIGAAGVTRFETAGERGRLGAGDVALFSHQTPVKLDWRAGAILTLQLPRAVMAGLGEPERLVGRVAPGRSPGAQLLRTYLESVWRLGLSPLRERHLVELAWDGLTAGESGAPAPSEARRAARLERARAALEHRAAAPDLTLAAVARSLGVSERTLERDFASIGTSFARELTRARLELARERLRAGPRSLAIAGVAYDAGFNDLSTFNRAFKARFGCAPSDVRPAAS